MLCQTDLHSFIAVHNDSYEQVADCEDWDDDER